MSVNRKSRYAKGDIVVLHGHADGENGPHPSDLDEPIRLAKIIQPIFHPNNADWTTEYVIQEPTGENASGRGDQGLIKPGEINRLAHAGDIAQAIFEAAADE